MAKLTSAELNSKHKELELLPQNTIQPASCSTTYVCVSVGNTWSKICQCIYHRILVYLCVVNCEILKVNCMCICMC